MKINFLSEKISTNLKMNTGKSISIFQSFGLTETKRKHKTEKSNSIF
mgnify:CR=1 FL=1